MTLGRDFYGRDALVVAPELLNKVLVAGECSGRIVEVEAYRADDPASHSFRGPTRRNAAMFGPPGHLYVYFTYGMHFCANVVTGGDGDGQAVLVRAVIPIEGIEQMRERRLKARSDVDLTNGPAKICQAFALGREHDGLNLCAPGAAIHVADDGMAPPAAPTVTGRIGIKSGVDLPWRWLA